MNVLVSINRGYVRHFTVMLYSLLKENEKLAVFVMHDDLAVDDENFLLELFPAVEFSFIKMQRELFEGFPTVKRYPYTIYFRIFAPFFLPKEIDRVLYLDCDLIVHGSLKELYDTPFGQELFIACSHTGPVLNAFNRIRLGGKAGSVYMNTGAVLMNLKLLRECMDMQEIRRYTLKNKWKLMLYDQDVLYRFFGDRVIKADSLVYNLSDRQLSLVNAFKKEKLDGEWVEKNNKIVHYIGKNKPWKKRYKGILGEYYLSAAAELDGKSCGKA